MQISKARINLRCLDYYPASFLVSLLVGRETVLPSAMGEDVRPAWGISAVVDISLHRKKNSRQFTPIIIN